ncbi:hypothetical protein PENTCL1PPCAC_1988 [Pristionchus entomophagus]|uniref:G protein-coupled receptor n=1 Tax=Pristionchus entomophagus TaxID=358040 RepID=A0AAV5SGK8_9BILA|nr:hypothetical protein PENTCL1PPCAC_1988 [Pristionchus entomophagus]
MIQPEGKKKSSQSALYIIFSHLIGAVSRVEVSVLFISTLGFLPLHLLLTFAAMRATMAMRRRIPIVDNHNFSLQPRGGGGIHEIVISSIGCLRTASIRGRSRSVIERI